MAGANSEEELDKYISNIADIPDDADVDVGDQGGNDDTTGSEQQAGAGTADDITNAQAPQDKTGVDNNAGAKQKVDAPKGKQSQQGNQNAAPQQVRPLGDGTFADTQGNIVDKDGKLIAQNGFAARMYQTNRRLKAITDEQTQQINQLHTSVAEYRSLATSIQNYNLDNNEVAQALDLAGRMKRGDVIGVAKDVIAMVTAQGYNVTDILGQDVGDSIEMRAMRRMLDERLAPITREEQDRQRTEEATRRAQTAYNQFVRDNEYADVHGDNIVQVMRREGVNAQTAYNRLLQFATRNNLDFSQPLAPQVQARQQELASRNGNGQHQQQQNRNQQKPMPNGASTRSPGAVPTALPMAGADDDWGSIISEVQRTIGH